MKEAKLFERIVAPDNLMQAWRKVRANGGGAGMDKVTLLNFEENLSQNLRTLADDLRSGHYRPRPYRIYQAPKGNGEFRPISILTVRDRIAQRATVNVIAPLCERRFLPCSYGFREGLARQDAVQAVAQQRDAGYRWVIDADIRKCFETLDHELLMRRVGELIHERRVLDLIRGWLRVGGDAGVA